MKHTKKILYILAIAVILLAANSIFGLNPFRQLPVEDIAAGSIFLNASLFSASGEKNIVKIGDKEVELKLDFKAGEEPYFIVSIPKEYETISSKFKVQSSNEVSKSKTISEEMGFAEPKARVLCGKYCWHQDLNLFYSEKSFLSSIKKTPVDMAGLEPATPGTNTGYLPHNTTCPKPESELLYHSLISNIKYQISNTVYAKAAYASDSIVPGVNVKLIDPNGEEIESSKFKVQSSKSDDGKDLLEIRVPRDAASFKPGVWKMSVEIETKKKILRAQQDFSWGVLAINTNKAVYQVQSSKFKVQSETDRAYLQMAVLDDKGETLCDADLELVVTSPSGNKTVMKIDRSSTPPPEEPPLNLPLPKGEPLRDGGIIYRSGKCGRNNVTDVPDYFAYYNVEEVGKYKMELTALISPPLEEYPLLLASLKLRRSGSEEGRGEVGRGGSSASSHTITDTFEAVEAGALPFEIERTGPTRIYPVAEYEMKIRVKANEDFEGSIFEQIPNGFSLIGNGFSRITDDADALSKIKETPDKGISFESLETRSINTGSSPICYNNLILNKNICQDEKFYNKKAPVDPAGLAPATEGDDPSVLLHNTTGPKTPGLNSLYHKIKEFLNFGFVDNQAYAAEAAQPEINLGRKIVLAENISLKAGDVVELSYKFDAPDVAPELFLLGPLELMAKKADKCQLPLRATGTDEATDNCLVYIEPRVWQIASDGLNKSYIRSGDATRRYVQVVNTTGLVGYWELDTDDYNQTTDTIYGKYGSDLLTAVSDPALTTGHDGRSNSAILFDGSADYLKQKVYAEKVGTVTMATVDTGALFNDTGQDFSPYVGASGASKPYMLVATDTGGKVAWGYIGEEGTGETLGDEILTNQNMETGDPPTGWVGLNSSILDGVADERTGGAGIQSLQITSGVGGVSNVGKFSSYPATTNRGLFKVSGWIKNVNVTNGSCLEVYSTAMGVKKSEFNSLTSWVYKELYFTAQETSHTVYFTNNGSIGQQSKFDDISLKQVTALPANTGVKIYSTKTGSTQSWANVESGFLPNSVASYEVRKTDFQITGAMTVGAWVKPNGADVSGYAISKSTYNIGLAGGYALQWSGSDDKLYFVYGGTSTKSSNVVFSDNNEWVFITATYDGSTVTFYRNGVSAGTGISVSLTDVYLKLRIGSRTNVTADTDGFGFFNGSIEKPFIYSRSLSDTEVLNMYQAQKKNFVD